VTLAQFVTEKPLLKVLSYNGIKPSLDTLSKGQYPLAKQLYLVSSAKSSPTALQFIQFTLSSQGRSILMTSGALPHEGNKRLK